MESLKIQSIISSVYENAVEHLLTQPKIKRSFSKWERLHLGALTSCYSSYKVTLQVKNKARTISHLDAKLRLDFVKYIEQVLDPLSRTKIDIMSKAEKFFSDLLLYLFTNKSQIRNMPNYIGLEALYFIDPEVQECLNVLISESIVSSISDINRIKDDKTEKDLSDKNDRLDNAEKSPRIMPVQDEIFSYILSKFDLSEAPTSQLEQYFDTLSIIIGKNSSLQQAILNRTDENRPQEIIKNIQHKLGVKVKESVNALIEPSLETYNVVLEDIKKLPNDGGYIGEVVAVLGIDGTLVHLPHQMAYELFPQRGSVYISNSHIKEIPSGYKFLPVIAERSSSHGVNEYRLQKYWMDVAEIIDLKYDFFDIDLLINAIKEYRFSGSRHEVWFRLRDGALLSSYSEKKIYSSQAFNEKWRFIESQSANKIGINKGVVLSGDLKNHSSIAMQSDIEVTKQIGDFVKSGQSLPPHVANRKPYILNDKNPTLSSSEFIDILVSTYHDSDSLRPLLDKQISRYVQEFEEKILALNEEKNRIESELHSVTEDLLVNKERKESVLKHLDFVLRPKIDNIKNDVVTALQDPILISMFAGKNGNSPCTGGSNIQQSRMSYPRRLKTSKEQIKLLSRLKLKFLTDSQIDAITQDLKDLISKGYIFEINGEKSYEFSQLLLCLYNFEEYFNIFSFFAENIEECLNLITESSSMPMVISGIDDHQSKFYRTAFDCTQIFRELEPRLIIAITNRFTLLECKQVIPLNTDLIHKIQQARDFDVADLVDICSEYGLKKLKFNVVGDSILYDLLFNTLTVHEK